MVATKIIIGPELLKLMSEWEIVDKFEKKTEYSKIRYDLSEKTLMLGKTEGRRRRRWQRMRRLDGITD